MRRGHCRCGSPILRGGNLAAGARSRPHTRPNQSRAGLKKLPIKINGETVISPMFWLKIAIELQAQCWPISNSFLNNYFEWRDGHIANGVTILVSGRRARKVLRNGNGKNSKLMSNTTYSYTPDVFLLKDLSEIKSLNWRIEVQNKASKQTKSKRTIKETVGSGVLADIEMCITTAAKNKSIKNELINKDGLRYIFSGSRSELLTQLKRLFAGKLIRSDRAYVNAIPAFAACGKYKRNKLVTN